MLSCSVEPEGVEAKVKMLGRVRSRRGSGVGALVCEHVCMHACVRVSMYLCRHVCAESSQEAGSVVSLYFFGWDHLALNCHL